MCYLANRVPKRDSKCKDPEAEVYLAYSNKPPENLVHWVSGGGLLEDKDKNRGPFRRLFQ